jgi:hypothetical protein
VVYSLLTNPSHADACAYWKTEQVTRTIRSGGSGQRLVADELERATTIEAPAMSQRL